MLQGMATQNFFATDLDAAREWYTALFGAEPYFVREGGYIEWRLGPREDEFGIVAAAYAPHPTGTPSGSITYWAVDDVAAAFDDLLARGATAHAAVREQGQGFVTASVVDPFGNVLGIMENVHFAEGLRRAGR